MNEEQYLREELNMRISSAYKHIFTLLSTMLTIWTAITAFAVVLNEKVPDSDLVFSIMVPVCLLLPIVFALFSSFKFRENMLQATKIATYIACFYNKSISSNGNMNMWEITNMDIKATAFSNSKFEVRRFMNGEYMLLGAFGVIIEFAVIYHHFYNAIWEEDFALYYAIVYLFILILAVFSVIVICKNTFLLGYKKEHIKCLNAWYDYAIKNGYKFDPEHKKTIKRIISRV